MIKIRSANQLALIDPIYDIIDAEISYEIRHRISSIIEFFDGKASSANELTELVSETIFTKYPKAKLKTFD